MTKRPFGAGHFLLSLDGEPAIIKDFDGGNVSGETKEIPGGPYNTAMKAISGLKFEPFTINVGMSMGRALLAWIQASFRNEYAYKNGSIVSANSNYKAQSYRHFRDALITKVTIPTLDASSKDTAFITVEFDPTEVEFQRGDNQPIQGQVSTKQKVWQPCNFRVEIGGLPCASIKKVESFTLKQNVKEVPTGRSRIPDKVPTKVEFPNLKLTMPTAGNDAWIDWFKDFALNGKCDAASELTGAIEFLAPDGSTLGEVELFGVGITNISHSKHEAGSDNIQELTAELYVERMALDLRHVDK